MTRTVYYLSGPGPLRKQRNVKTSVYVIHTHAFHCVQRQSMPKGRCILIHTFYINRFYSTVFCYTNQLRFLEDFFSARITQCQDLFICVIYTNVFRPDQLQLVPDDLTAFTYQFHLHCVLFGFISVHKVNPEFQRIFRMIIMQTIKTTLVH